AGSDSNLRGLLVEVETGGAVTNVGKVLAEQGNASLIGFAVNQKGKVSATTSVNLNGTVRLMAREGIQNPTSTGGKLLGKSTLRGSDLDDGLGKTANVTLDTASSTSVDLDTDKTTTAIDAQAQLKSAIEISGHDIVIKDQATVTAHSGNISVAAVDNPGDPKFKGNARIYLDSGSKIDASGVKNVSLPMERNVIEVELRKNELRDAPQQRDGVLYGEKVKVDIRDAQLSYDAVTGSLLTAKIPVADIKGAVDRIARNIDERSTDGGNINLSTSGSVVSQTGSVLDFSGGSVAYRDGVIATTQLMSQGQVVDIAKADPNQHYDSIVGSLTLPADKWGVKQSWQIPGLQSAHSESAYVDGKAGGHLVIQAYESALAGTFDGQTISGTRQRLPALQAAASSLYFDMTQGNLFGKQNVVFSQEKANIPSIDVAINRQAPNSKQVAPLVLNPASFKNAGIGRLSIRTNGTVTLQDGQTLALTDNAQLRIEAAGVDIQGGIVTHGGSVQVQPVQSAGVLAANPINMGTNASIDVSGVWLNDWLSSQQGKPLSGLAAINGGSVSFLTERGDLTLQTGSHIDASSGAWMKTQGKLVAGTAGAISFTAATQTGSGVVSKLVLDGDVSAWGLTKGGSLNLVSNQVLIDSAVTTSSDGQQLLLSPQFFQRGGFSDYKVTANAGSLKVAENTLIQPRQANR
ncbi:MAG: filamentous hemagglutinin, partial [Methylococcaceae bacterium]|nr:filamentous hemagglutinin [Methylococcaceae bacterium]